MFKNYLIIAYRSFLRQRVHTLINIFGLAIGLGSAVLICLYVYDELSFNSMHPNYERTYRIGTGVVNKEGNRRTEFTAIGSWARRLKEEVPEVEQTLRVLHVTFPTTIRYKAGDKSVLTDERRWVESSFTDVFDLDLVKGNKKELFAQSNTIFISETAAKELFGDKDPLGEVLTVNDKDATNGNDVDMTVTGVYRDYPLNSTFRHKYLLNIQSLRPHIKDFDNFMEENFFETYVMVKEGASYEKAGSVMDKLSVDLQKQFEQFVKEIIPVPVKLSELHFNSEATWDFTGTVGDKKYLAILTVVALLILMIACINYMNLTTAKATLRGREVGVRKSFGSSRKKLITQFLMESFMMSLLALFVSYLLVVLLLPQFNQLARKQFDPGHLLQTDIVLIFLGITLFAALAGGAYPAFVLSGFKPITVLKGKLTSGKDAQLFRKSLVTIQYVVALSLTIVAIVIFRQLNLMHKSKLNEHGDQVMMLRFGSTAPYQKFFSLKNDLLKDSEIEVVSVGDAFPRLDHWGMPTVNVTIPEVNSQPYTWNQMLVDFDFLKAFDLRLLSGRNFDANSPADSLSILLNAAAVKSMNKSTEEVTGQIVSITLYDYDNRPDSIVQRKVIGVVEDFPYQNMRRAIDPLILYPNPNLPGYKMGTMVYVKLPAEKMKEKISVVEAVWKNNFPDIGLQYYFVNDLFGRLYKSELTISSLSWNFSVLAILITVFGLFGLASFAAERRTKEIGVRKVHGASVWQIVRLLMVSFLKIFLTASVIVVPVIYFVLDEWLASFMYRTPLDAVVFGLSLGVILFVTIVSVGYETLKAAVANPVKALRYE